jgi:protein phosphatase
MRKNPWLGIRWWGGNSAAAPGDLEPVEADRPAGGVIAAGATDRGRNRQNNEDGLLCDVDRGLFVVCDGMGGMAAGENATAESLRIFDAFLSAERIEEAIQSGREAVDVLIRNALVAAGKAVRALAEERPECKGLGCTVVLAILADRRLHVANLGDSRAYLIRASQARQLTVDHTLGASLVAFGEITADELRTHGLRNHITAAIGLGQEENPAIRTVALEEDDLVVLCSDGLWDMVEDAGIGEIALAGQHPVDAVRALIDEANARGGHDNITAIVLRALPRSGSEISAEMETETLSIAG